VGIQVDRMSGAIYLHSAGLGGLKERSNEVTPHWHQWQGGSSNKQATGDTDWRVCVSGEWLASLFFIQLRQVATGQWAVNGEHVCPSIA